MSSIGSVSPSLANISQTAASSASQQLAAATTPQKTHKHHGHHQAAAAPQSGTINSTQAAGINILA